MSVRAIRFCHVAETRDAAGIANVLSDGLGLEQTDLGMPGDSFNGAVFPSADGSWVEIWPAGEGMPAGTMLQLVVDDADAYAEKAKAGGLSPQGPMDAHGERIYFLTLPGGLQMSFQSRLG